MTLFEKSNSKCGVCGKELSVMKGPMILGDDPEAMVSALKGLQYKCPKCDFCSCFDCCTDMETGKTKCKECGSEMIQP